MLHKYSAASKDYSQRPINIRNRFASVAGKIACKHKRKSRYDRVDANKSSGKAQSSFHPYSNIHMVAWELHSKTIATEKGWVSKRAGGLQALPWCPSDWPSTPSLQIQLMALGRGTRICNRACLRAARSPPKNRHGQSAAQEGLGLDSGSPRGYRERSPLAQVGSRLSCIGSHFESCAIGRATGSWLGRSRRARLRRCLHAEGNAACT